MTMLRRNNSIPGIFAIVLCAVSLVAQTKPQPTEDQIRQQADSYVQRMTLEEKIDYIGGTGFAVRAMPKLGLPAFEMSDGPIGVRSNRKLPSTTYAAGIGLAASWNKDLAERVGSGIGKDARARGIHYMLGPGVNIYRAPMNARNFEYFGEDPFLASTIATGYIVGMQKQGVSATVKHYLGNNSEYDRHNVDSIIDERTAREIYLPVFEAAVKQAHVGSIMDSYNLINGAHASQNSPFNSEVAKKEWGFNGVIMSDWSSTYDGVAAANGGLDLEMPTGAFMNRQNLLAAVQDGRIPVTTLDDKVRRIVANGIRFGWLNGDQRDYSLSTFSESNRSIALDAARETMVLLKNNSNLLPLDKTKIKTILVVGPNAYPAVSVGGGSARVVPFAGVSALQGIAGIAGQSVTVHYDRGLPMLGDLAAATDFVTEGNGGGPGVKVDYFAGAQLSGQPELSRTLRHIDNTGVTWDDFGSDTQAAFALWTTNKASSRRWTGYYKAGDASPYVVIGQFAGEGNGYRVFIDDKKVLENWDFPLAMQDHAKVELTAGLHKVVVEDFQNSPMGGRLRVAIADQRQLVSQASKTLASKADVVVIAAGFDADSESEGADRTFFLPFGQEELIREMAAQNKNVVVAMTSGGNVDPGNWLEKVPAYVEMWYPGEAGGTALAEILFGAVNPSGRLPATFEQHWKDNPVADNYYEVNGSKRVTYKEGVFVGYRGYEKNGVKPLFPFGYGLSYTTFKYSKLAVALNTKAGGASYVVSFDVTNTGKVAGADVAQVYVGDKHAKVPRPPKELKGFAKVNLKPGETRHVTVPLDSRSFAYYDVEGKQWRIDPGTFDILVGRSSDQIELKGTIDVTTEVANAKM